MKFVAIDHKRFRLRREQLGLSQRDLGLISGVTQSAVSRSERKPGSIGEDRFVQFTKALQVSPEWLRGERDAPTPPPPDECDRIVPSEPVPEVVPISVTKPDKASEFHGLEDILETIREEQTKGDAQAHLKVEDLRTILSQGVEDFMDSVKLLQLALDEYEDGLRKDVRAGIKSRIAGTAIQALAPKAMKEANGLVDSLSTNVSSLVVDMKAIFAGTPRRVVPVAVAPVPVVVEAPPVNVTQPTPGETLEEGIPQVEPPEEPLSETASKETYLLVGGSFPPHPDVVSSIRRSLRVDLEWVSTPKKKANAADHAAERIRRGSVRGVIIVGGFISHSVQNKIVDAAAVSHTPVGYTQGQSLTQVYKAVLNTRAQKAVED